MNDLEILDHFGPTSAEPSDAALAAARARLDAAMAAPVSAARRRPVRRLPLLVAAAAAAAVGIGVVPALVGSDDSIALAAVDPLTFPVTPTWLPEGVDAPVFRYQAGSQQLAEYGHGEDLIRLDVLQDDPDGPRRIPSDADTVDVNGQAGAGFADRQHIGSPETVAAYTIVWEEADGDKLRVTGLGRYADRATAERVADSVTERSQPVDLFLSVAPSGWQPYGYLSDHHILYRDPEADQGGDASDLTLNVIDRLDLELGNTGARDVHEVTVDGRAGALGRSVDMHDETVLWILQSTAPDGTAFSLLAPGRFTEAQVIEVAAGVRHR